MDTVPNLHELVDQVKSGLDLAQKLDISPSESVLVALFPEQVHEIRLTDDYIPWKGNKSAFGILGNWMSQTRLLDLLTPGDVRWWHVEKFAERFGLQIVPVRWRGKLRDIPLQYFEPGTVTGIRFYRHGPWFWPLEKPSIKEEASDIEKMYQPSEK